MATIKKTRVIPLSAVNKHIDEIVKTFKQGGVVLYPTDTQYGLGVIARNRQAVEKVNAIKHANVNKAVSIIVSSIKEAEKYVHVNERAKKIMEKHLPGALTVILPAKDIELAKSRGDEKEIGVRIPAQDDVLKIVQTLGEPITATSANLHGQIPYTNCQDILDSLSGIDLAIDGGTLDGEASTIIRFIRDDFEIIRVGSIKP